jgi:arylsulfatase A-like enzyme
MPKSPNILFLMADQLRADVLAPEHPCLAPNLKALAARGVRFPRAYTPNAVCSPARASLMTGLLPHNHGVLEVTHCVDDDQCCLRLDRPHWAQRLQAAGYHTGYFGKWHVERSHDLARFGWAVNGESAAPAAQARMKARSAAPETPPQRSRAVTGPAEGYAPTRFFGVQDGTKSHRQLETAVDMGLDFLRDAAARHAPWCCFVSCLMPHDPFFCAPRDRALYNADALPLPPNARDPMTDKPGLYRKSARVFADLTDAERREAMACYYATVTHIDREFARLLTAAGDDALVVLTTDHGEFLGAHGLYCKNIGAFEEAYRIPMVLAGPGIARGALNHARVGLHDLCPTLLDLAGAPQITAPDSRSFAGLLRNPARPGPTSGLAEYYGSRYRLTQFLYWEEDWKLVHNGFDFDELYNLRDDPAELTNLALRPDAAAHLRRMTAGLWRRLRETGERNVLGASYPPLRLAPFGPGVAG